MFAEEVPTKAASELAPLVRSAIHDSALKLLVLRQHNTINTISVVYQKTTLLEKKTLITRYIEIILQKNTSKNFYKKSMNNYTNSIANAKSDYYGIKVS